MTSREFTLAGNASQKQMVMGETSRANLKEYIKDTIRQRPDFNSSRNFTNDTLNKNPSKSYPNSQSNFNVNGGQNSSSRKEDATEAT